MLLLTQLSFFITLWAAGIPFLVAGLVLLRRPPKEINYWYGYRTARSMKTQKNWEIAQRYSARQMVFSGIVMMVLGMLNLGVAISETTGVILGLCVLIACSYWVFRKTERAIVNHTKSDMNIKQ